MAYEVEVKFQVENLEEIEFFLMEQEARMVEMLMQNDYYFNHPSRDFSATDEALRIREEEGEIFLTYKGPKIDKTTKTRKEVEIRIDNKEKMIVILESLGFILVNIVSKERRVFKLGNLLFSLDRVDSLGNFIEIEKVVKDEREIEKAKQDIFKYTKSMGLNPENSIRESYLELLMKKMKKSK